MGTRREKESLASDSGVLASIAAVNNSQPQSSLLPDEAVNRIVSFLMKWTLESASKRGLVNLLEEIGKEEWSGIDDYYRVLRLDHSVKTAVRNGDVRVLDWWMTSYCPKEYNPRGVAMISAMRCGQLSVLEWLKQQDKLPNYTCVDGWGDKRAVDCWSLKCARWFHEHQPRAIRMVLNVAYGLNFDMLQWAYAHRDKYEVPNLYRAYNAAAKAGRLDILEWLLANKWGQFCKTELGKSIDQGNLKVAKWLCAKHPQKYFHDPHWTESVLSWEIIEWLMNDYVWYSKENRLNLARSCMKAAAKKGDLRVIEYFYSKLPGVSGQLAIEVAAMKGDLPMFKRLLELGATATADAMDAAARGGHLEVVEWLQSHDQNAGCTSEAMNAAAEFSHLEVVQWLHANRLEGCTSKAMDGAVKNGHLEIVKFLHVNREEGCSDNALSFAAGNGNLELVKWLRENQPKGCTVDAMAEAAGNGHIAVLEYFHENRESNCKWHNEELGDYQNMTYFRSVCDHGVAERGRSIFMAAAAGGQVEVVKWLWTHMPTECTLHKIPSERKRGYWQIVKFLAQHSKQYDKELLCAAAKANRFDLVEWLGKHAQTVGGFKIEEPFVDRHFVFQGRLV